MLLGASAIILRSSLDALVADGTASDANVPQLIIELTNAFNAANVDLIAIPASVRRDLATRQSDDEIANLIAGIVSVSTFSYVVPNTTAH